MTTCVFRYCKNSSRNVKKSCITFHRFVHAGHPKREEWIKILQNDRSEATWFPTKFSCICSAHFRADDFYTTTTGRRFLKKSAIPYSCVPECAITSPPNSPTSLDKMDISDSKSVIDTPREIQLKKDLEKVSASKKVLSRKCAKLQRRVKYLERKTETLTMMVKLFNENFGVNEQVENKFLKKPLVGAFQSDWWDIKSPLCSNF